MGFIDDFDQVAQGGEAIGEARQIATVFLYPNSTTVRDDWVRNGSTNKAVVAELDDGLSTLLSWGAVDYYEVFEYTKKHPELSDNTRNEYRDQFRPWLKEEVSDSYYPDMTGCHYGIASGFDDAGGYAAADDSACATAFKTSNTMILGTGSGDPDKIRSFSIQEVLHTFISFNVAKNNGLVKAGLSDHEHDTGKIDQNGNVTPMATTWTSCSDYDRASDSSNHHASHGSGLQNGCDSGNSCDGGYTQDLTSCTIDAVDYTGDAAINNC